MRRPYNNGRLDAPLILAIIALSIAIIYTIFHFAGPGWDLQVRYLDSRTLINYFSSKISFQEVFAGEYADNLLYYFEPYREPLSMPIFALLDLLIAKPLFEYLMVVFAGYAAAVYFFGRELKADKLILFSLFLNSYIIYFFFIPNGDEGLAIIFVMLGIVYLLRKSPVSGLMFGLAALAKYPTMVLFPMVLLLDTRKKIVYAILLELLTVFVWGVVFDYAAYGLPFFSYLESAGAAGLASGPSTIYPGAIFSVVAYPIAFAVIAIAFLLISKRIKAKAKIKPLSYYLGAVSRMSYRAKVLGAFVLLSALGYAAIVAHNDAFTQSRYGFILSVALLTPAALLLSDAARQSSLLKYAVALGAIAILVYALYTAYAVNNNPGSAYYNPDNNQSIYAHAGSVLASLGFANCRFVSNTWVPMIYSGYDAYSPFILYTSSTLTPLAERFTAQAGVNYTTYTREQQEYPILVFKYTGVSTSFILNLNGSTQAYDDENITVYLPKNASCYRN